MSDTATSDHEVYMPAEKGKPIQWAGSLAATLRQFSDSPLAEWHVSRLGNVFQMEYGDSLPKRSRGKGNVPVYGSNGQVDTHSEAAVDKPGIILGRKGSIGKVEFSPSPFWPIDTTYYITQGQTNLNLHYLRHLVQGLQFDALNAASAIPGLNRNDAYNLRVLIPPLPEQRKIASVLYAVDQAIQKTEAVQRQTERVKRGLEQRLFTEGYRNHEIEEGRMVELPASWKFETLSEHTESSAFGPRFSSDLYSDDGSIAVLRTTDLDADGNISYATMPRAKLNVDDMREHLVEAGDLLITRSGTTGIATVWEEHEFPAVPGAFLIRFRLRDSLLPDYLRYYINSGAGSKRVDRRAQGGVQKNLSGSNLLNMRFPIPPLEEQREIVEVLHNVDAAIQQSRRDAACLRRLKRGLMQDLLTGRVRTADKNIDVLAEVEAHG